MLEMLMMWLKEFTPGAAGIWVLVAISLVAWWQGLPKIITSWSQRETGIEARLHAAMDAYVKRTSAEISSLTEKVQHAEQAHEECRREQDALRDEMSGLKRQLAEYQIQMGFALGKEPSDMVKNAAKRGAAVRRIRDAN